MMLNSARPCEGCGTIVGYEYTRGEPGQMGTWGRQIAPYMEMWRNRMWPVALGLALQDFAGAHVHDWRSTYHNFQTGESREQCRCGEKRTRWDTKGDP